MKEIRACFNVNCSTNRMTDTDSISAQLRHVQNDVFKLISQFYFIIGYNALRPKICPSDFCMLKFDRPSLFEKQTLMRKPFICCTVHSVGLLQFHGMT